MDGERLTTVKALQKTYPFVLMRLVVVVATILPIYWIMIYFAEFFFRLLGIETDGIVHNVMWLNFAWIGAAVGVGIFGFVRKTALFYVKAAHVIAITKLCTDDIPMGSLTMSAIDEMRKRFISVNLFYIADGLILKGTQDIGRLIVEQDAVPAVKPSANPSSVWGRLKNVGIKTMGRVVSTTLGYCDEIVLSYVYVRSRLNELYGGEEQAKKRIHAPSEKRKNDSIKTLFGYAVDGLCMYVKNCIPLLKASFGVVLAVTAFGWVIAIGTGFVVFVLVRQDLVSALGALVLVKVIYALVTYSFVEPYETIALVTEFYYALYDDSDDIDLEPVKKKLLSFSLPFRKMVAKSDGKEEAKLDGDVVKPTGSLLEENLFEVARNSLGGVLGSSESEEEK